MALLLDYYRNMWNNSDIAQKYWQCGANDYGNIFWFMNTNFRTISPAFKKAYETLKTEEGHKASEFAVVPTHQQSKVKQLTVRMRQTWLFYLDNNDRYQRSIRGKMFEYTMNNNNFNQHEKDILCYFFLLSADFNSTAKYIFKRTDECFKFYNQAGYKTQTILNLQKSFIKLASETDTKIHHLANEDYFYIANLYRPFRQTDFLTQFNNAPEDQKNELKKYVFGNIFNHKSKCILSKKFESSGNFNKSMILECAWILYVTKKLLSCGTVGFNEFVSTILKTYSEFYSIDQPKLTEYINKNKNVFECIYNILYDIPNYGENGLLTPKELKNIEAIDPTDLKGQAKQNQVSETLKQMAKEQSNYHCVLEDIEGCKGHYFTSKKENENYVEVHHFIPREFSSEFEHTIEVLENYVTLCPCCHRKIHHAIDKERKHMILAIYNKRKKLLEDIGIKIPNENKVMEFYKFDNENIG